MKKIFIAFAILISLILGAAFVIPIVFKDDIKAAIDEQIASSVNADVYFDPAQFGLTLFKNFPNITVSMGDFGVIGKDEFEGEVLMGVNSFQIVMDLNSVIFGDQPRIKGIKLDGLKLNVIVKKADSHRLV